LVVQISGRSLEGDVRAVLTLHLFPVAGSVARQRLLADAVRDVIHVSGMNVTDRLKFGKTSTNRGI